MQYQSSKIIMVPRGDVWQLSSFNGLRLPTLPKRTLNNIRYQAQFPTLVMGAAAPNSITAATCRHHHGSCARRGRHGAGRSRLRPEQPALVRRVPPLQISERLNRQQAEAALRVLRQTFGTFPFADAPLRKVKGLGVKVVDLAQSPGLDESTFLVGLLTATCRPNLKLAPGFLVRAPEISGASTGKGLPVRSICAIAFGIQPRAFTKGADRQELDKRLASDLIEAAPVLFLDNVNGSMLRSDTLASVLTERPVRVRPLGRTGMVALNSTAFIAVTGNGLSVSEDLARRGYRARLRGAQGPCGCSLCRRRPARKHQPGSHQHLGARGAIADDARSAGVCRSGRADFLWTKHTGPISTRSRLC
jgi:hypothetical protein